jgi:hypothetical protein
MILRHSKEIDMQNAQNLEIGRMNDVGVGYDKAVAEVGRVLGATANFQKPGVSPVVKDAVSEMVWLMISGRYSRVIYQKDVEEAVSEIEKQMTNLRRNISR